MNKKEGTDKRQELQDVLMQLDAHKQRMDAISNEINIVQSNILELNTTIQALSILNDSKAGSEILVPLGSGSFVRAELKEKDRILVGVGAGLSIEKTLDDAEKALKTRLDEVSKLLSRLQDAASDVSSKAFELNKLAEKLSHDLQHRHNHV